MKAMLKDLAKEKSRSNFRDVWEKSEVVSYGYLSAYEWDAAYLYLSFVLRKRGESDGGQRRVGKRKNGKMNLSKDDVLYIDNESVKECNFTQQRVS
ncbi:hypothetical protein YC2023_110894 [Brassica napus]